MLGGASVAPLDPAWGIAAAARRSGFLSCSAGGAANTLGSGGSDGGTNHDLAPRARPAGSGRGIRTDGRVFRQPIRSGCVRRGFLPGRLVPLDIMILLDQSGSMDGANTSGEDRWTPIKNVFDRLRHDPNADFIGIGLAVLPNSPGGHP